MKETKCETIRRELDELMLGDECSVAATQHLRDCEECREFHQKQTRLRQIVGGLGTVEAPPDFDFRLRARLANESNSQGFHLRALQWPMATRGVAVAAMLVLFVAGFVLVRRNILTSPATPGVRPDVAIRPGNDEPPRPVPGPADNSGVESIAPVVAVSNGGPSNQRGERQVKPRKSLSAIDSAIESPPVISQSQLQPAIFPIDASLQSLTVSIDDGHGNARTISVPTISFGSQRALATRNQYAPKGVW